jgi:hypothetical protein
MTSLELTAWQAYLAWRHAEQKRRAKELAAGDDDDEVIYY